MGSGRRLELISFQDHQHAKSEAAWNEPEENNQEDSARKCIEKNW